MYFIDPSLKYIAFSKEIPNMPAIRNQGGFGSCYGCAGATVIQKFICDTYSKLKDPDPNSTRCKDLPKDKMVSQLDAMSWGNISISEDRTRIYWGHNKKTINFKGGGFGPYVLQNSSENFRFMPESCYPFDQLTNKYGSNIKETNAMIARLEKNYNKLHAATDESSICMDCILAEINIDLNFIFTKEAFMSAKEKNSFGEFLYQLFFNDCDSFKYIKTPAFSGFPLASEPVPKNPEGHKQVLNKIIEVLNDKNRPVLISGLCASLKKNSTKCNNYHETVISGYRKACPTDNISDPKCKYQFKIHECSGEDWMKKNNGGWHDADRIVENLGRGEDYFRHVNLSWFEPYW